MRAWGNPYGLRTEWIQPGERNWPEHYDVFGELARRFEARWQKGER